jgi:PAS domain S-box-containing protein
LSSGGGFAVKSPSPEHGALNGSTTLKVILYFAAIILALNFDALLDTWLHPDIPYIDGEHIVAGFFSVTLVLLLIVISEILARRTTEVARESRRVMEDWQSTFDTVDDAILLLGNDQRIIRCNRGTERLFGIPASECTDRAYWEIVYRTSTPPADNLFDRMTRTRVRASEEVEYAGRWIEVDIDPKYKSDRQLAGAILIAGDITQRKTADHVLHESRERFRLLADHMVDVLFSTDTAGIITYLSPSVRTIFRCEPDAMVGRHFALFLTPQDKEKALAAFTNDIAEGRPTQGLVLSLLRPDGTTFFGELSASTLKDDRDAVVGTMGLIRDITERKQVEDRIKSSEEQYRFLFMGNPVPMWVYDRETLAFLAVNDFAVGHYGYSHDEFLHMTIRDIRPPELIPVMHERMRSITGSVRILPTTYHQKKDGTVITVDVTAHEITFEGRPAMLVMATDITEQKKVAEAMRRSTELLLQSQRVAQLGHYEFLPGTGLWTSSEMLDVIFGIDGTYGHTVEGWLDIIHPDDQPMMLAHLQQHVLKERLPFDKEYRIIRRNDRSIRWVHGLGKLEFDAAGAPVKMFGTIQDITDRKMTEARIEQQARLLDVAHDAILVRTMSEELLYMNKAAEDLYGWTFAEAARLPAHFFFFETEKGEVAKLMQTFQNSGEWEGELRQKTKAGKNIVVQSRWTLVRDEHGKPVSRLIINRDITEHRSLEARLRRAQRLESLGTLAGGIAHDLNNVLAPILLSLALLDRKVQDPALKRLVASLEKGAERGSEIVKQVLLFARGSEQDFSPQQIRYAIKEVATIINETFPRNIELRVDCPADLAFIRGDATQLHQVILNLCVNARDAMAQGGVLTMRAENLIVGESNASLHASILPGTYVLLTIADTGTGIPIELHEKIFEPFFTTKEVGKGTGLGLSTAYAILKDHKAVIMVDSTPGEGTAFRIYFPTVEHQEEKSQPSVPLTLLQGNGECILVVDDEQGILAVTRTILEAHGYKVIVANNGRDAIAIVGSGDAPHIDVAIMDINMPGLNGIRAAEEITQINPAIKIIIASGLMTEMESLDPKRISFSGYLMKPYRTERMLSMLQQVMGKSSGHKS